MTRKIDELARLKRIAELIVTHLLSSLPPDAPLRGELTSAIARTTQLRGARMLVRDLTEWSQDLAGEALDQLNHCLATENLPTLSLLRSREDNAFCRILERNEIRTEDEYRLVNARVSNASSALPTPDREMAEHLLASFVPGSA